MQDRCYAEIHERVGTERPVNWNDRTSLPFVEAFMLEVWRRATLFPVGVVRRNAKDTHINGYFIPKNTMIFPNMWSVHFDEKLYAEPQKFDPTRFINKEGKVVHYDWHLPFSLGKRQCAGEGVARMELFLIWANLIQKLKFDPASDETEPLPTENEVISGFTTQPGRPFNVCVRAR